MENPTYFLFCDECKKDILCEKMSDGTTVVHCPKCIGECLTCECHLANNCFEPGLRVIVNHPDSE
jgi:hypothetical protein